MCPSELTKHRSRAAALILVLSIGGACGGGEGGEGEGGDGSRPTISPTRTPTATSPSRTGSQDGSQGAEPPTPTRSPDESNSSELPSPTRPPTQTGGAEEGPVVPPTEAEPEPERTTEAEPTTAPTSPDASEGVADSTSEDEGGSQWAWWLLALLVGGAAAGIPLLVRARRRGAWLEELASAESEVVWFTRALMPELRRVGSLEQLAGGWAVGEARVVATEDRLTALESTASDDSDRERVRSLRDAVRLARARLQQLTGSGRHDTWVLDLDAIMADLEVVLGERESHLDADRSG